MSAPLTAPLSGASGEYFVAGELCRRGWVATITPKSTQSIDILVSTADGSKAVGIQVKTNKGMSKEWVLSKKDESLARDNLFYVFVNLNGVRAAPTFHVVPSSVVCSFCTDFHRTWLMGPRRDGKPRKDTDMRVFKDPKGDFLDQWELLGLGR
jgi:hypothetical protein